MPIDVVTTRTQVRRYGAFDLEWLQRIDTTGVTQGWRVWCHPCGDYQTDFLHTDIEAKAMADAHRHTVDPVTELRRMAQEIPPLLGDDQGVQP